MPVGEYTAPRTVELLIKQFETAVNECLPGAFPFTPSLLLGMINGDALLLV